MEDPMVMVHQECNLTKDDQVISTDDAYATAAIDQLHKEFLSGGDIESLDVAIEMAEQLLESGEPVEPLLAELYRTRDRSLSQISDSESQRSDMDSLSDHCNLTATRIEQLHSEPEAPRCVETEEAPSDNNTDDTVDLFQQLANMFEATGEQEYLDAALGVVEDLEIIDQRIISDVNRLRFTRGLKFGRKRNEDVNRGESKIEGEVEGEDGSEGSVEDVTRGDIDMDPEFFKGRLDNLSEMIDAGAITKEGALESVGELISQNPGIRESLKKGFEAFCGLEEQRQSELESWKSGCQELERLGEDITVKADINLVERAINLTEDLTRSVPAPKFVIYLHSAMINLLGRIPDHIKRNIKDIEKGISDSWDALGEISLNDPARASLMAILGMRVYGKYQYSGDRDDLEQAIHMVEKASQGMPLGHACRGPTLKGLGLMVCARILKTKGDEERQEDMVKAVKLVGDTVAAFEPHVEREEPRISSSLDSADDAIPHTKNDRKDEDAERLPTSLSDMKRSVEYTKKILASSSRGDPLYLEFASVLDMFVPHEGEDLESLDSLDKTLAFLLKFIARMRPGDPTRVETLLRAGKISFLRYEKVEKQEYLDEAIDFCRNAATEAIPGNKHRLEIYRILVKLTGTRSGLLGLDNDTFEMMEWMKKGVAEMPQNDPERVSWLALIAKLSHKRHSTSESLDDLEQALLYAKDSVKNTSPDEEDFTRRLETLVSIHMTRYWKHEDAQDLDCAIKGLEKSVSINSPDLNPLWSRHVLILGRIFEEDHRRCKKPEYRDRAINLFEEAVPTLTHEDPNLLELQCALCEMFYMRFSEQQDMKDYKRCIQYAENVLALPQLTTSDRSTTLTIMSRAYMECYRSSGGSSLLEKAISAGEMGLKTAPTDEDTNKKSRIEPMTRLLDLGAMYDDRYRRYGDPKDLEIAIEYLEKRLSLYPNSPSAALYSSLSTHYLSRYECFGCLDDLDHAIDLSGQASKNLTDGHRGTTIVLSGLSTLHLERYNKLGLQEDLDTALDQAQLALQGEKCNQDRFIASHALSSVFQKKYWKSKDPKDLLAAIKESKTGVEQLSQDDPDRCIAVAGLCTLLVSAYEESQDMQDIEEAIKYGEQAVADLPRNHPSRSDFLMILGGATLKLHQTTKSMNHFYYTINLLYEAWHCHLSPIYERIRAAHRLSRILGSQSMWQESSSVLQDAVKMLPKLSRRHLRRRDQENRLEEFTTLAVDAVAFLFKAGEDAARCLRILEFGRGVIMGMVIDSRTDSDISNLRKEYPEVFQKFKRLCKEIDQPLPTETPMTQTLDHWRNKKPNHTQERRSREHLVGSMETLVADIRDLPGFEGFQLPPRPDDLISMASEGPIVIVICTDARAEAIIVTNKSIKSQPLLGLTNATAEEWMSKMPTLIRRGKRSDYQKNNCQMDGFLVWLWQSTVEPVLKKLQLKPSSGNKPPPRLWWIGTGTLAMAPFHAAGRHKPGSTENTFSHVISSYIPTIKALSYARRKKLELLSRSDSTILLVTMPTTPSKREQDPTQYSRTPNALNSVVEEVEGIMKTVATKSKPIHLKQPSAKDVIKELPWCQAVHFACHGVSDRKSPSQSRLLLRKDDGTKEGILDYLTVEDISEANIENAQIAYLSACSTAQNSTLTLADESIHIASAFQLAGFSHVLATQWASNDSACREVAEDFYKYLFDGSGNGHDHVSLSFHRAVKNLREKYRNEPIKWACYIHTGA